MPEPNPELRDNIAKEVLPVLVGAFVVSPRLAVYTREFQLELCVMAWTFADALLATRHVETGAA